LSRARVKHLVVGGFFALLCGSGCWEQVDRHWFDQMKNGPAVQTLAKKPFDPPEGTIPAGGMPERITPDNPMFATPMYAPEVRDLKNPIPATPESVARGKHEFETYCAVCHGEDGMAAQTPQHPVTVKLGANGAPPFPLAATPSYTDGMIFTKIRYGRPLMPGYPQIPAEDRWHIINYLRTLFKGIS
jgi:mono/diheme cytochrome c family protein